MFQGDWYNSARGGSIETTLTNQINKLEKNIHLRFANEDQPATSSNNVDDLLLLMNGIWHYINPDRGQSHVVDDPNIRVYVCKEGGEPDHHEEEQEGLRWRLCKTDICTNLDKNL